MNIVILTAKYGMGHYTAAMSLKQELENKDIDVEVVDFFEVVFPKLKKAIYGTFNFLVSKCNKIYNFFYRFMANTEKAPFQSIVKNKIEKLVKEKNAEIIISTFPVCSKYISAYKKVSNSNVKLYTYITDVEISKEWITEETNAYFVASYESKKQMIEQNVEKEKIKVVGIPVRKEFKEVVYQKQKSEIVIMGGGLGLIPCIEKTLENLSTNTNIHITLLAGKNQKLFDKYNNCYKNVTVIGYTDEVYKFMEKAELIITKPGGITLFEAIHLKTPIYVLSPFLSQEIGNAKFIENNGLGKVVWNKSENIAQDILYLINTPIILEKMKSNMQRLKNNLQTISVLDVYREENFNKC